MHTHFVSVANYFFFPFFVASFLLSTLDGNVESLSIIQSGFGVFTWNEVTSKNHDMHAMLENCLRIRI